MKKTKAKKTKTKTKTKIRRKNNTKGSFRISTIRCDAVLSILIKYEELFDRYKFLHYFVCTL